MPLFLLQCQWNFTPFLWLTSIIKIRRDRKRVTNPPHPPHTRETRSNSAEYIQYKPLTKQLGKTDALLDVKFIGLLHMAWPWAKLPLPQSCQANRPSNFAQIREIIKPLCRQAVTSIGSVFLVRLRVVLFTTWLEKPTPNESWPHSCLTFINVSTRLELKRNTNFEDKNNFDCYVLFVFLGFL